MQVVTEKDYCQDWAAVQSMHQDCKNYVWTVLPPGKVSN